MKQLGCIMSSWQLLLSFTLSYYFENIFFCLVACFCLFSICPTTEVQNRNNTLQRSQERVIWWSVGMSQHASFRPNFPEKHVGQPKRPLVLWLPGDRVSFLWFLLVSLPGVASCHGSVSTIVRNLLPSPH